MYMPVRRHRSFLSLLLVIIIAIPILSIAGPSFGSAWQDEGKSDKKKPEELPLKTADKIEFVTDEGTWMSLDVSPDGKTVVFDLLGDIYTMPIGGGEAKRIIGGLSFDSQP